MNPTNHLDETQHYDFIVHHLDTFQHLDVVEPNNHLDNFFHTDVPFTHLDYVTYTDHSDTPPLQLESEQQITVESVEEKQPATKKTPPASTGKKTENEKKIEK